MTLRELAITVLKKSKKPLSAVEIWNIAESQGLTKTIKAKGKNPYATFTSVLYTDEKRKNSTFIVYGENPKKFTLK